MSDLILIEEQLKLESDFFKSNPKLAKSVAANTIRAREERGQKPLSKREKTEAIYKLFKEKDAQAKEVYFNHSILSLCALPYRNPPESQKEYTKKFGKMHLTVEPGVLLCPVTKEFVPQGIPYGPKARLLEHYICTLAVRYQSPTVHLEATLSGFIKALGYEVKGGPRGTIKPFKEQLQRLMAAHITMGFMNHEGKAVTLDAKPVERVVLWPPTDSDGLFMGPSSITLHDGFYKSLMAHAMPIDVETFAKLSKSSQQMDILLWLNYRLRKLDKPLVIRWETLQEQFCQSEETQLKTFKQTFKKDLSVVNALFDDALPLQLKDEGLAIYPSTKGNLFVPKRFS